MSNDNTKHTPGRIKYLRAFQDNAPDYFVITTERTTWPVKELARVSDEEMARRIVACVNACEGLETRVIEGFGGIARHLKELVREIEDLAEDRANTSAKLAGVMEQRDELLAALTAMVEARDRKPHSPHQATEAYIKACAAIANAHAKDSP